jgi:hypothetical protein
MPPRRTGLPRRDRQNRSPLLFRREFGSIWFKRGRKEEALW